MVTFKGGSMVTNQILTSRELMGITVRQRTSDEFFNIMDLLRAGNAYRASRGMGLTNLKAYEQTKSTQEFLEALREKNQCEVWIKGRRGRKAKDDESAGVWVHPLVMIDFALWLNPKLKIETYEWIMDFLVRYRCSSGDSYKRMCGALYQYATDKVNFLKNIKKLAIIIKKECGLSDSDAWNGASENQLKKRDRIQDNIAGLCGVLKDTQKAIELGILQTRQQLGEITL